jgi:hypothetical protein
LIAVVWKTAFIRNAALLGISQGRCKVPAPITAVAATLEEQISLRKIWIEIRISPEDL